MVGGQADAHDHRQVRQFGMQCCDRRAEFAAVAGVLGIGNLAGGFGRPIAVVMVAACMHDGRAGASIMSTERVRGPVGRPERGQRDQGAEGEDGTQARHRSGSLGKLVAESKGGVHLPDSLPPCDALHSA